MIFACLSANSARCWKGLLGALLVLCVCAHSIAEPLQVTITDNGEINKEDPSYFFEQLLVLALDKTKATDGEFVILHNNHGGGIARDRAMLIAGVGLDVMWGSVTREREQQLRVIPVDLLKNLNNYRVLLIAKDSQATFSKVSGIEGLKKLKAGSGEHWTDGKIMRENGFTVTLTASYLGLFKMLAAGRFQFISRGLHEVGYDFKSYQRFDLVQEESLLLAYDTPIKYCFFVNKKNTSLAERIERGLIMAKQDGSFDQLFYAMPSFKEGEYLLKHSHRTVIQLKNANSD